MKRDDATEKRLAPVLGLMAILASLAVFVLGLYVLTIAVRFFFALG